MNQRPKVWLLGDSIRMSYQPIVTQLLKEEADVTGPAENGQFSAHTLASLERWQGELGPPDVVHWNNGIHDVGHNPDRTPVQFALPVYLDNLKAILSRLRAMAGHIVWATTIPVHPERPFASNTWAWRNEEIDAYNRAALDLMVQEGIAVNDLHAAVASNVDVYLAEDMLHLSVAGQQCCADAVAVAVRSALQSMGTQ